MSFPRVSAQGGRHTHMTTFPTPSIKHLSKGARRGRGARIRMNSSRRNSRIGARNCPGARVGARVARPAQASPPKSSWQIAFLFRSRVSRFPNPPHGAFKTSGRGTRHWTDARTNIRTCNSWLAIRFARTEFACFNLIGAGSQPRWIAPLPAASPAHLGCAGLPTAFEAENQTPGRHLTAWSKLRSQAG